MKYIKLSLFLAQYLYKVKYYAFYGGKSCNIAYKDQFVERKKTHHVTIIITSVYTEQWVQ